MRNRIIVPALLAAVLIGGYGLYRLGINEGMQHAAQSARATPAAPGVSPHAADAVRQPLYWQDPMNPGQKFDKPGKSPFMDMELVPVYADGGAAGNDDGKVSISPRVQQNLGIRTAEVRQGRLTSVLAVVGSVAYDEHDVALVQARGNGFVERLLVSAPFDPVRKGQALAELYLPDWIAAQEEFLTVKRMQGSDISGMVDGARQRMRLAGMDDEQIRLVEASGKLHPRIKVSAPIDGVISELAARTGMTVTAGTPMFRINGLGTVWVNAEVPESFAAQVRVGNTVEARSLALPGAVFKGRVGAILPEVNPATRTLKARIELANPRGALVPGMFVSVNLVSTPRGAALLVPSEAVIRTGTRSVVMLAQGGGQFTPVEVEPGAESDGQTEILRGLEAGQTVVASGQFLIDSEASIKASSTRIGDASKPVPTTRAAAAVQPIGATP